MRGWLIVNGFLKTQKFERLYTLLQNAAQKRKITLEIRTGDTLLGELQADKNVVNLPDFVIFWDKDVYLAKRLTELKVPLFNGVTAVEICDNKILTVLALLKNGVKTPKTVVAPKTFEGVGYTDLAFLTNAEKTLGYPMVIKEAYGSFGLQVYLAENRNAAEKIVRRIGYKDFLMQELIAQSRGKDVRANVVGGQVVCAMLRENEADFRSNVTNGGKASAYTLTKEQERTAVQAAKAVGADFAGVDILFGKEGEPIVCEVNSNPHFESTLKATGVDLSEHIIDYIIKRL